MNCLPVGWHLAKTNIMESHADNGAAETRRLDGNEDIAEEKLRQLLNREGNFYGKGSMQTAQMLFLGCSCCFFPIFPS